MVDTAEFSQVGKAKDIQTPAENAEGVDAFDAFRFEHYSGSTARQSMSEKTPGQAPGQVSGEAAGEASRESAQSKYAQAETAQHESDHSAAAANGALADTKRQMLPDLERLKDPSQASAVLQEIGAWVKETEKNSCPSPELLAKTLNDFAWKTVQGWKDEDAKQAESTDRADIYAGFDKLLDKLEELKKGDPEWNRTEDSTQERFYKNLPWEFMPHE